MSIWHWSPWPSVIPCGMDWLSSIRNPDWQHGQKKITHYTDPIKLVTCYILYFTIWQSKKEKYQTENSTSNLLETLFLTSTQSGKINLCSRPLLPSRFAKHSKKGNKNIPPAAIALHSHQLLSCPVRGHGWLSAGSTNTAPCIWNRTWAYIPLRSLLPLSPHYHHCPTSLLKQAAPSAGGKISWAAVRASQGWGWL